MHPLRITVDARAYFMRAGIARYARAMLGELIVATSDAEWHVLISDHHTPEDFPIRAPNVRVSVSRAVWLGGAAERRRIASEVRAAEADVFYSLFPPIALPDVPSVTTVVDMIPVSHPQLLPQRVARATTVALARAVPAAARLIAISEATAQAIREFSPDAAGRILVAPCGLAGELPLAAVTDGTREGVLFVGTIESRKNVPLIVEAARLLPDVPFTLVGKPGWGDFDLRKALGAVPNVTWRGRVDDTELAALYRRAALFVYPSAIEGFGLPVLEAIHAGVLPIVSFDPALREIAPHPELAAPADPAALAARLRYWLEHRQRRALMLASLRIHVKRFTWERGAAVVRTAFLDVTGRR